MQHLKMPVPYGYVCPVAFLQDVAGLTANLSAASKKAAIRFLGYLHAQLGPMVKELMGIISLAMSALSHVKMGMF